MERTIATADPDNRYGPVVAAVKILRIIRKHPKTLNELAAVLGCNARTARRLINALASANVVITEHKREGDPGQPLEYGWTGTL